MFLEGVRMHGDDRKDLVHEREEFRQGTTAEIDERLERRRVCSKICER